MKLDKPQGNSEPAGETTPEPENEEESRETPADNGEGEPENDGGRQEYDEFEEYDIDGEEEGGGG